MSLLPSVSVLSGSDCGATATARYDQGRTESETDTGDTHDAGNVRTRKGKSLGGSDAGGRANTSGGDDGRCSDCRSNRGRGLGRGNENNWLD
jgi:hypothetical protein